MNVSIVGAGYVGLVTGLCLSEVGHNVTCIDIDAERIARVSGGRLPIYEPGLDDLLARHLGKRFTATSDLRSAVLGSELTMIAVGTPLEDGRINLRYVADAASAIGAALAEQPRYHAVVVKSTVVPGTTDGLVRRALEEASGKVSGRDFGVGMNPEFLREGEAVADFLTPDRIVLGGHDRQVFDAMDRLYAGFPNSPRICTDTRTAEMIKYASNALFATLISFSNEIGNLCTAAEGVDIVDVMHGVHLDRRITSVAGDGSRVLPGLAAYLKAGCGFGGSCFPKDLQAIVQWSRERERPAPLLDAVVQINARQPGEVLRLLGRHFSDLRGVRVAVLGLSFKPGTDDIRESPALRLMPELLARGADIRAYDPVATSSMRAVFGAQEVDYRSTLHEALGDADAVVLLTAWPEFQQVPDLLDRLAISPVVIDGRRVLDPRRFARFEGIGRSAAAGSSARSDDLGNEVETGATNSA